MKASNNMQATWNGQVLADAQKEDLLFIEGNWYFPPSALKRDYFRPSETHTTCPWKGEASYYDVTVGGETNADAAWYYPAPKASAIARVHGDFTDYVAFWRGISVS